MKSLIGALSGALLALATGSANAVAIVAATPRGEVAQVQQVVLKFSEAVVAFGDPRLTDPATVTCQGGSAAGAGRWSSDRVWLFDLREPLGPGARCEVAVRSDWKPAPAASAGASAAVATLTGASRFSFSTGGPAVLAIEPRAEGSIVEEDQHFVLRLNGAAVEASVVEHAWCEVEGIGERLPLRIVAGELRQRLLKARRIDPARGARTLIVRCERPLPNGVALRLVWGVGIAAAANPQVTTRIEQRFSYTVRAAFAAEFSCERERAGAPCMPIRPMSVRFSAPVPRATAAQLRLRPQVGEPLAPVFDKDDKADEVREVVFPKPLAENATYSVELPASLKDNAGRPLANATAFPLKVQTGSAPPIAKFAAAPFGIVERHGESMLPVTLRHVQADLRAPAASSGAASAARGQVRVKRLQSDAEIFAWYVRLQKHHETQLTAKELGLPEGEWFAFEEEKNAKGRIVRRKVERRVATREVSLLAKETDARRLDLPQLASGDPRPFEVVGIPLADPGYHVVEIESLRLGESLLDRRAPMFVRTGVLVTNLGVHFKLGRENSLVWVTTLDRGRPVEGADVVVNDCNGKPLWSGRTDAKGLALVARALEPSARCSADDGFFVSARKADERGGASDVAFVFSGWQKGIEPWRFGVPTHRDATPDLRVATVFDRTLLRAGETVSMKHFARLETSAGLAPVPTERLPTRAKVVHQGTGQEFVLPVTWSGAGRSAVTTWNIPPAAKLGVYEVVLERDPARGGRASEDDEGARQSSWSSGNFRVEEFRLPLVDARISGPKAPPIAATSVAVDVQMSYFSGGAMAAAPLRASALLKPRSPGFAGYDEFSFEPARELKNTTQPAGDNEESESDTERNGKLIADKVALTTDRNGAAAFTLKDLPATTRPSRIEAELTFNDPNGEVQTVATRIDLWPSALVLGGNAAS